MPSFRPRITPPSSAFGQGIGKSLKPADNTGIAGRGFVRSFVLADGLDVDAAHLEHGLLHVDMSRPEDLPAVRRIPITTG